MIGADHRLKPVPPVFRGTGFSGSTGFSLWKLLALTLVPIVVAPAADLTQTLDALVDSSPVAAHSNFGIHVVDLKTGKPLYARYEDRLLLPASNMKLFTTALALQKLGPGYRFQTRLLEEASGDLTLVGSGDPSMSGRVYPYSRNAPNGPPLRAIEDFADQALKNGLTHVRGDVIGDDALYPWDPFPPSWTQSDALGESGAPISALSVADNFITIAITPGAPGDLATLSLAPALEYFAIDNRIQTVAGTGAAQIRVTRAPGSRQFLIDGTVPAPKTKTSANVIYVNVAIDDPALYAACALYDALTRRGVSVSGHPVARHRSAADAYKAPEGTVLATRASPPVAELVRMTDKVSENLHAELLLREVGRVDRKAGTREAGLASLNAFLAQVGGASADLRSDFRIDDGSGLSRNTLVTPQLITRLLEFMYQAPGSSSGAANTTARDAWIAMLPIGGEDGTLARRLGRPAEARAIHAKTGTLNRAIALSGYADSRNAGWLAFSILVNDFAAPQSEVEAWVDKIALALLE